MISLGTIYTAASLVITPATNPMYRYVPFVYDTPITTCIIECSTNMTEWREAIENYDYFYGTDNTGIYIESTRIFPNEFFRIKSQPTQQ